MTPRPLRRRGGRGSECGYVTAETALALPSLLGIGFALVFIVAAVGDQVRCGDAAWEAARGLARGEPSAFADTVVREYAPGGAAFVVRRSGDTVTVRVSARLGVGSLLPPLTVAAEAGVPCEPGTGCTGDGLGAAADAGGEP